MQVELDTIDVMLIERAIDTEIDFLRCYGSEADLTKDLDQCIITYKDLQTRLKQCLCQE